jgi:glutamate N-acetyltransferase/amino-acid N-acetyltransferase
MHADTFVVELRLGSGSGRATVVTSDLGHGYVDVNAGYRS